MDALYFELAYVPGDEAKTQPFMRLCLTLEKRFPNIQWWQQIQDICDIATENENCFIFRDTWLRTTVTVKNPDSLFSQSLCKEALRKRISGSDGPGLDDHSRTSVVQRESNQSPYVGALATAELIKDKEPQIAIRRNVLPRLRYWMKLLEFYPRSHLTRNFYTRPILDKSLREGKSLQEICRHSKCALAKSLRPEPRRRQIKVPAESASMTTSPYAAAGVVDLQFVNPQHIYLGKIKASGGEGSVWEVVWGNCTYALKAYNSNCAASFDMEHKIAMMRSVSHHPHIVQEFGYSRGLLGDDDSGADQTRPNCLLMELLDGDLRRVMYEVARSTKPLSRLDKLDVLLQIASAMRRLHENKVVHGDLKPGNILLGDFEVSGKVRHFLAKVADFGSAQIIESRSNFVPSMGTTLYASPEVLMLRKSVMEELEADGRAKPKLGLPAKLDVYSFGVMAYEILTDSMAFGGKLTGQNLINVAEGKTRLIDSKEWKSVNRFGFGFYNEVVPLVEKCLEWDSTKRPTFFKVCATLRCAKSNLQTKERTVLKLNRFMSNVIAILPVLITYILIFVPCCL